MARQMDSDYEEYLKSKSESKPAKQILPQKKEFKKEKLELGQSFKEYYQNSKSFKEKMSLFNSNLQGIKNNEDTANRFINMENIINAYAGDEYAMQQLDELLNNESECRMSNIIRRCIEGDITPKKAEQDLFAELHGINSKKMPDKEYSDEELINLCIIKEMCPSISVNEFVGCAPSQLSVIAKAAAQGSTLDDLNLLTEFCVLGNIEQTRKDKALNEVNIKIGNDDFAKTVVYDFNKDNNNVEIYEQQGTNERELGVVDKSNNFIKGNLENVKLVMSQSDIIKGLHDQDRSELSKEIDRNREITTREAKLNPMSKMEREAYDKEVEEAEQMHQNAIKKGFLGNV